MLVRLILLSLILALPCKFEPDTVERLPADRFSADFKTLLTPNIAPASWLAISSIAVRNQTNFSLHVVTVAHLCKQRHQELLFKTLIALHLPRIL